MTERLVVNEVGVSVKLLPLLSKLFPDKHNEYLLSLV